ncbi:MAG TPA: transposase [Terriglobales bacterium]|nr:transposase [Terriglobales bacterium]
MPAGLKRYYGAQHLHFITSSCYRRQTYLGSAKRRDLFLRILEEVRKKYRFVVVGYVVMPEHFHLLISEPEVGNPSTVLQVLKQRVARRARRRKRRSSSQPLLWEAAEGPATFWQTRFYDFNVFTAKKRIEKLKYMHRNPVKRGLVTTPGLWRWSRYRAHAFDESGPVLLNQWPAAGLSQRLART